MGILQNVKVSDFRRFLESLGLSHISTTGGHEKWAKAGMLRPVIFQTHIDPIPETIIRNNLRTLGIRRDSLESYLKK